MKKIILIILIFLFLVGCETQQERDKRKKEEEIKKITEELKQSEVPEVVREWLIDTKMNPVTTILCMTTSKKCEGLKKVAEEIKKEFDTSIHFVNLDEVDDNVKSIYKTTYKLSDYTGYLPYIILTNKEKLVSTHTDSFTKEEFVKYLKENKIISEISTTH